MYYLSGPLVITTAPNIPVVRTRGGTHGPVAGLRALVEVMRPGPYEKGEAGSASEAPFSPATLRTLAFHEVMKRPGLAVEFLRGDAKLCRQTCTIISSTTPEHLPMRALSGKLLKWKLWAMAFLPTTEILTWFVDPIASESGEWRLQMNAATHMVIRGMNGEFYDCQSSGRGYVIRERLIDEGAGIDEALRVYHVGKEPHIQVEEL